MATYNELQQRISELKSRTGKGSISPKETFDLMDELLSKTKGVDMTAQPLVVVKSYDTLALANADRNPINPATNKPLALGQLISITADGTNNAVYRLASLGSDGSPTWEKQAELGDMTNYAKQTDLVQLAGDVNNKILNIKPVNLWDWGKLNAVGINVVNFVGQIREYSADGAIINPQTIYVDIPISDFRGKKIFFGFKITPCDFIEFGQFYNGSTQLSHTPTYKLIGTDAGGYRYYSLTHDTIDNIVPMEATHVRIQWRNMTAGLGKGNIAELYAGETPYSMDVSYKEYPIKSYKWLGILNSEIIKDTSFPNTADFSLVNDQLSVTAGNLGLNLNSVLLKGKGKRLFCNIRINNTSTKHVRFQLLAYNNTSGVYTLKSYNYFAIKNGELSVTISLTDTTINHFRLISYCAEPYTIESINFSEEYIRSNDVKIIDNSSLSSLVLENRDTLYEAMQENLSNILVGTKQFRKITSDAVADLVAEVNKPTAYYTPNKFLPTKVENLMVVDTKGTIQDSFNRGRVLLHVSPDGWMYFRHAYIKVEKIRVEDFLSNLTSHDGSGINSDAIDWLELPASQTTADKAAKLAAELPKWKMYDDTKSSAFQNVYVESAPGWIMRQMANGSLVNQNRLIRKDGTVVLAKLNNPVIGNPTHLIIKEGGFVLYELQLKNGVGTGIKWGEMKADQGAITYASNIFAAINFNNNKTIVIGGLNLLNGHTYEFVLRGRRYGTNCVNGSVELINVAVLGTIQLTDTILGGTNSSTLVDNSTTITLNKDITQITLRAVAPNSKTFGYGNGATATPNWGYHASGDKMLVTEYEPSAKRAGMAYLSQDNGESYDVLFDVSLNENFCNIGGGHIHGGCFDPYWRKVVLVLGDSDFAKGIYHADYVDGLKQDNVSWTKETAPNPFYGVANGEQHCSAFPHEDFLLFGTDCLPTGIFRMPRINKKSFTKREPSKWIAGSALTHIPSMFFRKDENSPIFIATMRGAPEHTDRLYNTNLYHATWDGIHVQEIFKDKIKSTGFGNNSFMGIWHYNGKVFMTQFGDNRFANNFTLFIGDYSV